MLNISRVLLLSSIFAILASNVNGSTNYEVKCSSNFKKLSHPNNEIKYRMDCYCSTVYNGEKLSTSCVQNGRTTSDLICTSAFEDVSSDGELGLKFENCSSDNTVVKINFPKSGTSVESKIEFNCVNTDQSNLDCNSIGNISS
ncbi:hypothetical protein K502DRAFT_327464 [Neoconidiobolus thromboides FSU 785]|nr:hypothetical protein K502DRAFT_327464 [Neoconidiobolus thromboides FSU 785]